LNEGIYISKRLEVEEIDEDAAKRMPRNLFRGGYVPHSLVSKRVKIPPVLFSRIGAEADSGRVSIVRGNLKSLRRSLARSKSEPVVGYAKRQSSVHLEKFDVSMGAYKRRITP